MHSLNPAPTAIRKYHIYLNSLFYIIPLLVGLIYWLAFFPGVMSFDSVSQWDQLSTFKFTDWYPAIHAILMWILTRIWYSPAIVSLFQVIIASLVIGYGLNTIRNVSRLPGYICIAIGLLITANPLVGVIDITLWKDVLYGFFVLLLTIYLLNLVNSDGEWICKPTHYILLGCTLAFIWLIRFNGFPVVLVSLVTAVIIYKKYVKHFAYSSVIAITIILFVLGPIYSWFNVNKAFKQTYGIEFKQSYGVAFIHPVVPYVNSPVDLAYLSEVEKQYLNQIYPLINAWPYSCYDATVFFYKGANFLPVIRDPSMMVKIFTQLAIRDPKIMLHHFICLSSFVWQPNQPKNVYLETILLDNYNPDQHPSWKIYKDEISQNSLLPKVRDFIKRIYNAEWKRDIYKLIWRPALYMYLFLASIAFLIYRTGHKKWLLLSVPLIAQSIGMMFTSQLQAVRYQYPVYLIAMLFTIPLLFMGWKKTKLKPIENGNP
jgi:hypothetical protein